MNDIPCFASDEEEVRFWETHAPTMKLFNPRGMSLEQALRQAKARKHPAERSRIPETIQRNIIATRGLGLPRDEREFDSFGTSIL